VPFLAVKVRETALTKGFKKINRKALERTSDYSGQAVGGDARVDRAMPGTKMMVSEKGGVTTGATTGRAKEIEDPNYDVASLCWPRV
jgi:hypothetical protein